MAKKTKLIGFAGMSKKQKTEMARRGGLARAKKAAEAKKAEEKAAKKVAPKKAAKKVSKKK